MFDRKIMKKNANKNMKNNYFNILIVSIIMLVFTSFYSINFSIDFKNSKVISESGYSNTKVVNDIIESVFKDDIVINPDKDLTIKTNFTSGVLSTFFNNVTESSSFVFGMLNGLNQLIFKDKIFSSIIIMMGAVISFVYYVFVNNVLAVGEARFHLQNRIYKETKANDILFLYRLKKVKNSAKIMLQRAVKNILWSFTIVGGFIKFYEYRFIPFILAEDPEISSDDCFKLSKEMTDGLKFQLFKLDISFILYDILYILTLGISGMLYSNSYKVSVRSEVYNEVRGNAKSYKMKDELLFNSKDYVRYPFANNKKKHGDLISTNFNRNYSITSYVTLFFAYSFAGYLWEVLLYFVSTGGKFINRGTFYGPWLPIYGAGGVLSLILLKKIRNSPTKTFIYSMLLSGIIEYSTSLYLEIFKGQRWWDYTGHFMNLNGRITLEGLIFFAMGCMLSIYVVGPLIDEWLQKVNQKTLKVVCIVLMFLFLIDLNVNRVYPNTGEGITIKPNQVSCLVNTNLIL